MLTMDIISDVICPWCYIGKAKLDRALVETGRNPFDISWRIFQLNPEMPREGMDRQTYLSDKFGGPDRAKQIYDRIAEAGTEAGLEMRLDLIQRTPNSMDAHRLIRWARSTGNQSGVVSELFIRYFERGADIADHDLLLEVAVNGGMDRAIVARLLAGNADREVLEEEDAQHRRMGVTGVPTFVIDGRYVVQGAQEVSTWTKIIEEISERLAKRAHAAEEAKS